MHHTTVASASARTPITLPTTGYTTTSEAQAFALLEATSAAQRSVPRRAGSS